MENKKAERKAEKKIGDKVYWSTQKAAEYVGISAWTISVSSRTKRITSLKLGGSRWYLKEWLDAFINRSTAIGNKG